MGLSKLAIRVMVRLSQSVSTLVIVIWFLPSRAGSTSVRPGRARSPRARPGPGARQHGHVLLHGGEAHRIGLREPRDRGLVRRAATKDVAAGRVGQGTEDLVDDLGRGLTYNHIVVGYLQIRKGDPCPQPCST